MAPDRSPVTRRHALKAVAGLAAGLALGPRPLWAEEGTFRRGLLSAGPITKPIPSTGEQLPVVGAGTHSGDWDNLDQAREWLRQLVRLGGRVVHPYGEIEIAAASRLQRPDMDEEEANYLIHSNVNAAATELGVRDKLFLLSTERPSKKEKFEQVKQRTGAIDAVAALLRPTGPSDPMPWLRELKQAGQFRYIGGHWGSEAKYWTKEHENCLKGADILFLSLFGYSIWGYNGHRQARQAEERILPFAQDNGIAVIVRSPFQGSGGAQAFFSKVRERPLPPWVAELGITSWGQFALKYVVSQPAVVCVTPSTSKLTHFIDNLGAAQGQLADGATRRKMVALLDSL